MLLYKTALNKLQVWKMELAMLIFDNLFSIKFNY